MSIGLWGGPFRQPSAGSPGSSKRDFTAPRAVRVVIGILVLFVLAEGVFAKTKPSPTPVSRESQVLNVALDDNYPPFIFRSSVGKLEGYLVDYWSLWEKKTGIRVNLIGTDWGRAQGIMASGQADVLDTVFYTPERDRTMDFTPGYADIPVDIYVRKGLFGVTSTGGLRDFKVGVKEGDACVARLTAAGVTHLLPYRNYETLIQAAGAGQCDVFCMDAPPADYLLAKEGLRRDFHRAFTLYAGQLHRTIRHGNPQLLKLLQQGDKKISLRERKALTDSWLAPPSPWVNPVRVLGTLLLLVLIAVWVGSAWIRSLRRQVAQRTEQLNQERRTLGTLIRTIPDLVWLKDANGIYRVCNPAAERFTRCPAHEVAGKTDAMLFPPEEAERFRLRDEEILRNRQSVTYEEILREPETGRAVTLQTTKVPMYDDQGEPVGIVGIARDITEEKQEREMRERLENRMRQAQKLESLGVLAGGIAHDFNNLLTSILGNADLALEQLSKTSGAREHLRDIESASRRAAELCRQLLAYSGKGRFQVRPLDLRQVVEEMAHLLFVSISKNAVLKYNFQPNLPAIEADAAQMRQVVMNLIINASEAIGGKDGVIGVTTGVVDCDEAYLKSTYGNSDLVPGRYVTLEVSDTGTGMDSQTMQKIFDPFFTTKFTGRGLGLAAVLGIVRGHHGGVKVYSEPGKGTTFKLLFPACAESAGEAPSAAHATDWRGTGKILLVDDEPSILDVGRRILQKAGWTVLTAANGEAALEVFRSVQDIDGVVIDLTMPRMDGEVCFREMRRLKPGVKVILSSGYNEQDVINRFTGKGLAGFIQKPYVAAELLEKVRQALASPPGKGDA